MTFGNFPFRFPPIECRRIFQSTIAIRSRKSASQIYRLTTWLNTYFNWSIYQWSASICSLLVSKKAAIWWLASRCNVMASCADHRNRQKLISSHFDFFSSIQFSTRFQSAPFFFYRWGPRFSFDPSSIFLLLLLWLMVGKRCSRQTYFLTYSTYPTDSTYPTSPIERRL